MKRLPVEFSVGVTLVSYPLKCVIDFSCVICCLCENEVIE